MDDDRPRYRWLTWLELVMTTEFLWIVLALALLSVVAGTWKLCGLAINLCRRR